MSYITYPFHSTPFLLSRSSRSCLFFTLIFFTAILALPPCSHAGNEKDFQDMQLIVNSVTQAIENVHSTIEAKEKMLKDFKLAHNKFGEKNAALEKQVKNKEKEISNLKEIMKKTQKKLDNLQQAINDEKKASEEAKSKLSKIEKEKLQALEEKAKLEQDKVIALEEKAKLLDEKKKLMSLSSADQIKLAQERDALLEQAKKERQELMEKTKKEKDEILKQNKKKEQELLNELEREKKNRGDMMKRLESVEADLKHAVQKNEKIQISQWLQQQAVYVGDYLESPDTSMLLSNALSIASESVKAGIDSFGALEHNLNTKIDTVYATSYNSHISKFIAYAVVLIPVLVIYYIWSLVSRVLTIRHIVFFFSCFNSSFFGSCLIVTLALKRDPLYAMMRTSKTNLLLLCLLLAVQFFMYCYLLFLCIIRSKGFLERLNFAFQLALYCGVGVGFRNRVFKPVLHRVSFPPLSVVTYSQFLFVLGFMLVLTVMSSIGTPMGDAILGSQVTSAFNFPRTGETLPRSAPAATQVKPTKPSSNVSPLDVPFRGDSPSVLRAISRRMTHLMDKKGEE